MSGTRARRDRPAAASGDTPVVFGCGLSGSGKGQLGRLLRREFGIRWLRIGARVRTGTQPVSTCYSRNEDWVCDLVRNEVAQTRHALYVDGFPRTDRQLNECRRLTAAGLYTVAVWLEIEPVEAVARCNTRRLCPKCLTVSYDNSDSCTTCGVKKVRRRAENLGSIRAKIADQVDAMPSMKDRAESFSRVVVAKVPGMRLADVAVDVAHVARVARLRAPLADDVGDLEVVWQVEAGRPVAQ
jgi:adenylate kinase family enzyme